MLQALTIKGNVCAVWMRLGERRFPPKLNFSIRVSNYTNWGSNQHVFHRQHSRSFTNMHAPLLLCAGSTDARGDIVTSIRKNVGPTSEMRLRPELRGGLALLIYANECTQSNKSCVLLCLTDTQKLLNPSVHNQLQPKLSTITLFPLWDCAGSAASTFLFLLFVSASAQQTVVISLLSCANSSWFFFVVVFLKVTTWCPSVTLELFEVTCFCFWLIFLWHHSCLNCLWGRLAHEKPCSFPINGFPITNTHHNLSTIFVIMKAGGKSHKQTREQKGLK